MNLALTSILAAALLSVALFCGWRGARPYDPTRGPRMVPWSLLMMLAAAGLLLILVHLAGLLGLSVKRG